MGLSITHIFLLQINNVYYCEALARIIIPICQDYYDEVPILNSIELPCHGNLVFLSIQGASNNIGK